MLRAHVVELAVAILRCKLFHSFTTSMAQVSALTTDSSVPRPLMAFACAGAAGTKGQALSLARESALLLPRKHK